MTPRSELRDWILARARDDADAKQGSSLVAAFVAEAIRDDRRKKNPQVRDEPDTMSRMIDTFFNGRRAR